MGEFGQILTQFNTMVPSLIGTLAVILLVAAFIGTRNAVGKLAASEETWKLVAAMSVLGGVFGIYGNISGFEYNGAVISVRDIGPMLAGVMGGPVSGLAAGMIAGLHRLMLGGITAQACVVATCCIGLACGLISRAKPAAVERPLWAFLISACMETFHLCVVLAMVRPFEQALEIVKGIAVPFVIVNALGFMLMVIIIHYTRRQHELALERSRMQSELSVANVIQHSLLPHIGKDYPGRPELDVGASMEAAKEVGGDFYDVFFVDKERLAFVVGDVSGKGIPAAMFMATAKITLQNCIRDIPSLADAIATANDALCSRNEAEMFVTVWVGVLNFITRELTFVSAGHNPPVLVHRGGAEFLKVKSGLVLAGMEGIRYREHNRSLERGDTLFLYTDGVTEAETAAHELFGEERLLDCLEEAGSPDASGTIDAVKAAVEEFVNGNSQSDDMTVLCVKLL
ncbi:MAG: SpoIIE family protein phosphatase [Lachnospiraceae bacterium]|nr:SpoIIE family protein phosphatase [Lachnospiraceae bacterium]